jgi:hypothetical protein
MAGFVDRISALMDRAGALLGRYAGPIRDALIIVGLARAAYYFFVQDIQPWTFIGLDARAYWGIDLAHPYVGSGVGEVSTYLYSPAFAQLLAPLSLLPFPLYVVGWIALSTAICAWLVRPWPWAVPMLILPILYEILVGNIHFLIALAIVAGFRAPATWAFGILTKITPSVGPLWFAVRREWRSLAVAVGATALIVAVSAILAPSAWADWIAFLLASPSRSELLLPRLALGAALVVLGAATGRRWLVPVAVFISLPVVWINAWVILLAVIRLREPVPSITGGTTRDAPRVPVTGRTTGS